MATNQSLAAVLASLRTNRRLFLADRAKPVASVIVISKPQDLRQWPCIASARKRRLLRGLYPVADRQILGTQSARRLIGGAAGHSALTTDVLVRFVVSRRFAGFPPVRLSLQSGQTDARLQCRVLWATSSIRISRVMRSCGMEKLAARPAIISDADSIESAISSPQAVLSGRGVASLCNLT